MNTRIILDHEPVADGGYFARAVLLIEGTSPQVPAASARSPQMAPSMMAANSLAAENVQVAVRPGAHAEFIQMRHTFESEGRGNVLTIHVGDVYCLDQIRIRLDALVGAGAEDGEAEIGKLVVLARLRTDHGTELETVELPLLVSTEHGGRVRALVSRMPIRSHEAVPRRKGA